MKNLSTEVGIKSHDAIVLPKDRILYTSRTGRVYFQKRTPENNEQYRRRQFTVDKVKPLTNGEVMILFIKSQIERIFTKHDLARAIGYLKR